MIMESEALRDFYLDLQYEKNDLVGLERRVKEQVTTGTYNQESNLTTLKYYGLYPDAYDGKVVASILILAMMRLPSTDFTEALYQIPQPRLVDSPIADVIELESGLERCEFQAFWKKVESSEPKLKALLYSAKSFRESIRNFIAETVGFACLKISSTDFILLLDIENDKDPEYINLVSNKKWHIRDGIVSTDLSIRAPSSRAEDHISEASRHLKTSMAMLAK
eukprot:Lankesteria_metandrocarpae@DN1110_c0_g1_i1.p1